MAFRMVEARKQKEVELAQHRMRLDAVHDELAAKRDNWVALNEYKEQEDQKRRMSIAYRLDSWKKEKMAREMWRAKQQMLRDEDARLRAQDWEDLQRAKRDLELEERSAVCHRMAF